MVMTVAGGGLPKTDAVVSPMFAEAFDESAHFGVCVQKEEGSAAVSIRTNGDRLGT
jgi:hypothetical protein